ncbi:MAG TPA: hypothetical protein VIX89_01330, partial [Bryobacteraceae bacterium]
MMVRPSEAGALADLLLEQVEGRALTGDVRSRLAARIKSLRLSNLSVFAGSLQKDPIHPSVYYIAVGKVAEAGGTMLLRIAPASSPSSGLFPDAQLIGRMRTSSGREIVINAVPFTPSDRMNVRTFVERVDTALAPRPQGAAPAIEVNASLGAFDAFRTILKSTGKNLASVSSSECETAMWCAAISGWREGYTAALATDYQPPATGFTKYNIDASLGIEAVARAYDEIQTQRRRFDFEISFVGSPEPTAASDLSLFLEFFKARGQTVQFIAPNFRPGFEGLNRLADVAQSFNAMLSVHASGQESPEAI